MRVQSVTLGEFIGRGGSYFLNRKKVGQRVFSFLIVSLARGHILGEKPTPSGYQPHPSDVASLEDAQELRLTDFAKIATGFEDYIFPPTLNRSAIATLFVDSTPGWMMRSVVTCLLATGILPKAPIFPPDWEKEELSCSAFDIRNTDRTTDESSLALTIAPVVIRKQGSRGCFTILQHPKSRENPHLRRHQERCHPQHLRHRLHGLERGNKRTMAHRILRSPLKRPPRRQRQLLVRANTKAHAQLWYNGSQTCSANSRNL